MTSTELECTVEKYERELRTLICTEALLRESLAKAEAMLRQEHSSPEQLEILNELLARQQDAMNGVAGLTPRRRKTMELVLAGCPSKDIVWFLGRANELSRTIAPPRWRIWARRFLRRSTG